MRVFYGIFLVTCLLRMAPCQSAPTTRDSPPVANPTKLQPIPGDVSTQKSAMRKIYEEDQSNRNDPEGDAKRRELVQRLVAAGKIQTPEDYYYAAYIFHHGQKPSDYLYAHVLAVTAVDKGLHDAMWLSAATLDRYLVSMGQPQIFGTQFGALGTWKILRPAPRDEMVFDREMVPDAMRTMWCVTSKAMHDQISGDMNSGRPFKSTRTCPLPDAQFDPK